MRSTHRFLRRSGRIFASAVLLLAAIVLVATIAPRGVERILLYQLGRVGIVQPSLRVRRLAANHIQLSDIRLQEGRIRLNRLDIHLSLQGLRGGKVDRIVIDGFEWRIRVHDGIVDLGLPPGARASEPSSPPGIPSLPVGTVELRSSCVWIERENLALRVPLDARLETVSPQRLEWAASSSAAGRPLSLDGDVDLEAGVVKVAAQLPVSSGGRVRLDARAQLGGQSIFQNADFSLSAEQVEGFGFSLPRLHMECAGLGEAVSVSFEIDQPLAARVHADGVLRQSQHSPGSGLFMMESAWRLNGTLPADSPAETVRLPMDLAVDARGIATISLSPEQGWRIGLEMTRSGMGGGDELEPQPPLAAGWLLGEPSNLAGPTGEMVLDRNGLRLRGAWQLFEGVPLSIDFLLPVALREEGAVMAVEQDWFALPDSKQLRRAFPDLGDGELAGEARFHVRFDPQRTGLVPELVAAFRNVSFSSRQLALDAKGVSGQLQIERFAPLSTPGNQRIRIDSLRAGTLELERGEVVFRLENPESLLLEQTVWHLPQGGLAAVQGARIDLLNQRSQFDVQIEQVDLIALLDGLTEGKIAGSGRVCGRIPVILDGERIRLGEGYLYSVPGFGRLQIRDEEWISFLMLYLNEALSGHPYLSTAAVRMEQALRDFEYSYLTIDLTEGWQGTAARIELRGKGLQGDPPQEIAALILNINDLDELINRVLGLQKTQAETIDRTLGEWLDF